MIECKADDLIEKAAAWSAANAQREAMIRKWQQLETELFAKAKLQNIDCEDACRSDMPEAQAMRLLDQDIEISFRALQRDVGRTARNEIMRQCCKPQWSVINESTSGLALPARVIRRLTYKSLFTFLRSSDGAS